MKSFLKSSSYKTSTEKRKERTEGGRDGGGRSGKKLHHYLLRDPGQEVAPDLNLSFLFLKVRKLFTFNIPFSS